ncbi:unnamed protein product, partial [marine sediment metagenome]
MVVGGVVVDEVGLAALADLGVKDSKKLSPVRREELAPQIGEIALGYELRLVEPARIDETNLNLLDIEEIVYLICKFSPEKVFFDVPTHPGGVGNFVGAVRGKVSVGISLVGENHADEKYPVVSAASILAKVERDRIVSKLRQGYGDFGSGYLSDAKTQDFLRVWFEKFG